MVPVTTSEEAEHPGPTEATIKELYAHAFACAHPECTEWLYRPATGSSTPVLNSRVAHIHARRPGGPRWLSGMSHEDNRGVSNLLLLCIPHSYEIDEDEHRFPATLLQEWRVAQRQDFTTRRQAWTITDDQAHEIAQESFASPGVAVPILTAVVRAAERLVLRASSSRSGPVGAAAKWRAMWERNRRGFYAYDDDGNRVFAEPPRVETERYRAAVVGALETVSAELKPLVEDVMAEVATARHAVPPTAPWCDWLTRAATELLAAASSWPGPPPAEDDGRVQEASVDVRNAADALASALRGENPDPPPLAKAGAAEGDSVESAASTARREGEELLARHRDLLDRARPWRRVTHRPYDAELRALLAAAAVDASTLPIVIDTLGIDLGATAGLAAGVARNAEPDELDALIALDRTRRPIVVAVAMLFELSRVLDDAGHSDLAKQARTCLLEELSSQDWASSDAWTGNDAWGSQMFNIWSHLSSPTLPQRALGAALYEAPERLDDVVLTCAPWVRRESTIDGSVRIERSYRELPPWFPADAVRRAAALQYPQLSATTSPYDDGMTADTPEVELLLRHVLRLAAEQNSGSGPSAPSAGEDSL